MLTETIGLSIIMLTNTNGMNKGDITTIIGYRETKGIFPIFLLENGYQICVHKINLIWKFLDNVLNVGLGTLIDVLLSYLKTPDSLKPIIMKRHSRGMRSGSKHNACKYISGATNILEEVILDNGKRLSIGQFKISWDFYEEDDDDLPMLIDDDDDIPILIEEE